jgi:hypothetical protein
VVVGRMAKPKDSMTSQQNSFSPLEHAADDESVGWAASLLGTGIGAVIGWLTALIWQDNLVVFGVAVAVGLMACNALGLKSAARLVGATICLMVLAPAAGS